MEGFKVMVESSGRHVHVTEADLETLFGKGFEFECKKNLSQPGQFLTQQKVDLVTPKGSIRGVSIIGPCRKATQVELSITDARPLGLNPPVRESGDLAGSEPCTIVGPKGKVELKEGVIVAMRHVHFTPEDAAKCGVRDKEMVQVKVEGRGDRSLIFDSVVARVNPTYATAMHIDYDEANAAAAFGECYGYVMKKS
jgi:putative phosphotransacetylase